MNTTAKKGHARVDVADALRGFSVLAIVLLHAIEHFNFYHFPDAASRGWLAAVDTGVWQSLFFLFSGKAYAIFALLFGFSFSYSTTTSACAATISACVSAAGYLSFS